MSTLDTLIHRFLDDQRELSPEDLDELIAGLRGQPARAAELREQLVVDDLVAQKLSVDRRNFLAQVEQRIADFERSEDEIDSQVAELHELAARQIEQPSSWSGNSAWVKVALALSLAAAIAGFFIVPQLLPRPARAVAKVIAVQGGVTATEGETSAALGISEPLLSGQQITAPQGSSLTIEYEDRTTVQIGGNSRVTLGIVRGTEAKQIDIEQGDLWADVAQQTSGAAMQFVTPHAVATVLGTRLRLTVSKEDTLLEVSEGHVRLDRSNVRDSIDVDANESGLASDETLDLRPVIWPGQTDGLAYAFDPFVRREPRTRNPATGNWLASPLHAVGDAAVNDLAEALELRGGYFHSAEDGADIVTVCQSRSEFSLELVYTSSPADQPGPARIVGLEGDKGQSNFLLLQQGSKLLFSLQTDSGSGLSRFEFALARQPASDKPTHLTLTYRGSEVKAYQDGVEIAASESVRGTLAAWQPGPLVIGGDSKGGSSWTGAIEALAIYHRWLPADEVAGNVRNYRLLAGRP